MVEVPDVPIRAVDGVTAISSSGVQANFILTLANISAFTLVDVCRGSDRKTSVVMICIFYKPQAICTGYVLSCKCDASSADGLV